MNSRGVQYILYNITSLNTGWRNPNHIDILVSINANMHGSVGLDLSWEIFCGISNGGAAVCSNDFPPMGILGFLSLFIYGSEKPSPILDPHDLVALKEFAGNLTNGSIVTAWSGESNCCKWDGVVCENAKDNGSVCLRPWVSVGVSVGSVASGFCA
ncbi:hypothetical protein FH972_017693 [Carpinus fangiana]|uniref:Leucine-rich repeat-containing N-terminal plant-type domain-containing protein n=1 Tax=Carpinus fangiana TaxID=176857 RepID=A0A5N6RMP4_9ROSI|nr:hypothetical protein FH972_017693 [Carpinus fangiana]